MGRPVSWGAVFMTYVGLIVAIVFTAITLTTSISANRESAARANNIAQAAALEQIRTCIRSNIDAAVVRLSTNNTGAMRLADQLYPILDCKQTQISGASISLVQKEIDHYVKIVRSARFPIVKNGKIVGSRASLLEGVSNINDVGKGK